MEIISKNAKAILKLIQKSKPNVQETVYDIQTMDLSTLKMSNDDLIIGVQRLIEIGVLSKCSTSIFTVKLTDKGKNYFQYVSEERKNHMLKSVVTPIIVAVITSIITSTITTIIARYLSA